MKHLDPITTIFETGDNGGIKITHILSKRVVVSTDISTDSITVIVDSEIRTQSKASTYTVEQYTQWLHDTFQTAIEMEG